MQHVTRLSNFRNDNIVMIDFNLFLLLLSAFLFFVDLLFSYFISRRAREKSSTRYILSFFSFSSIDFNYDFFFFNSQVFYITFIKNFYNFSFFFIFNVCIQVIFNFLQLFILHRTNKQTKNLDN